MFNDNNFYDHGLNVMLSRKQVREGLWKYLYPKLNLLKGGGGVITNRRVDKLDRGENSR